MAIYTTDAEVSKRLSLIGVELRTDHDFNSLNQSEEWASREIDYYLQARYPSVDFATNGWTKYVACVFAVFHLCWTRLNAIPQVVREQKEELEKKLQKIADGEMLLPGAATPSSAPALINQRVALGSYPPLVVESGLSVGPETPPARVVDPFQPPRFTRP